LKITATYWLAWENLVCVPPGAPMEGPNVEARLRGRAIIRETSKGKQN